MLLNDQENGKSQLIERSEKRGNVKRRPHSAAVGILSLLSLCRSISCRNDFLPLGYIRGT